MRCKAYTERFNCGCCEDVTLYCELRDGHFTPWHETTRDENGIRYALKWRVLGSTPVPSKEQVDK